jgi:protein involved in polysaccharide export with SLBB domain
MGQVRMPGVLMLRSTMTLLDAIMQSGGPTRDAEGMVYLVRSTRAQGWWRRSDLPPWWSVATCARTTC